VIACQACAGYFLASEPACEAFALTLVADGPIIAAYLVHQMLTAYHGSGHRDILDPP
jgi:hypothetical protein